MTKRPMLANPVGRSTPEWIGKTADSVPPKHVRARIFDRAAGICHISGRKIQPGDAWDLEHVIRLADKGENRESNLRPALRDKHRKKTAQENIIGKEADRQHQAYLGIKDRPARPIRAKGFEKREKVPKIEKPSVDSLPRRVCGVVIR